MEGSLNIENLNNWYDEQEAQVKINELKKKIDCDPSLKTRFIKRYLMLEKLVDEIIRRENERELTEEEKETFLLIEEALVHVVNKLGNVNFVQDSYRNLKSKIRSCRFIPDEIINQISMDKSMGKMQCLKCKKIIHPA